MVEFQRCPHCDARVVPSAEGICPACRSDIHAAKSSSDTNANPYTPPSVESDNSSRPQQLIAPTVAVFATSVIGGCGTLISAFTYYRFSFSHAEPLDTHLYLMSAIISRLRETATASRQMNISRDAFLAASNHHRRTSACGHCVQDARTRLILRSLPCILFSRRHQLRTTSQKQPGIHPCRLV